MSTTTPESQQPPKKPRGSRFTLYPGDIKRNITYKDMAVRLYYSVQHLEAEESIMPHVLLDDAYQMAGMLLEAEGLQPDETVLDRVVFHYLKLRQQCANQIVKEITPTKAGKQ
jgi:hypothetical protein